MKVFILTLLAILLLPTSAGAMDDGTRSLRRQADSQFRIAEKAYRKAVRDYGENLEGMPDKEKSSACRKMSSALHDNRVRYQMEDMLDQAKYRKKVNKLEGYSTGLGCN